MDKLDVATSIPEAGCWICPIP